MASVTNIGVPGQPMNNPPLTPWQAAVRDALNSSDVTVNARIAAAVVTDHGALSGLGDDDHPQYLKPTEVLAGANVTVDTSTTPGSVIIAATGGGSGGSASDSDQNILANQVFG